MNEPILKDMRDYDTEEIAELLERMKMGPKHPDYDNGVQKKMGEMFFLRDAAALLPEALGEVLRLRRMLEDHP